MNGNASVWARLRTSDLLWPLLALGMIMLFNVIWSPNFFRLEVRDGHLFGSLVDVLNRGAPLMLIAIGMTMVIATAGVDLSVGAVAAISAAVATVLIGGGKEVSNTPMALAILAALAAATVCGIWNGLLVSRARIQPMVATLVLMVAGRGIAQLITDGQIITIYYSPFYFLGGGYLFGLPFSLYLVAALYLVAWAITRRTALGLFIESIGTNARASYYSGIDAKNLKLVVYAFCAFCAGLAGLIISSNVKSADANNVGLTIELDAILAVVIGGTLMSGGRFTLAGAVLGALLIQSVTTTIYALGVPPEVVQVAKAIVVLVVVLLYSQPVKSAFQRAVERNGAPS